MPQISFPFIFYTNSQMLEKDKEIELLKEQVKYENNKRSILLTLLRNTINTGTEQLDSQRLIDITSLINYLDEEFRENYKA